MKMFDNLPYRHSGTLWRESVKKKDIKKYFSVLHGF